MNGKTVILAAGDFPRKGGTAWKILAAATRVVACDSAADAYYRCFRTWPDVVVGDFDSTVLSASSRTGAATDVPSANASRRGRRRYGVTIVHIPDQDTNDLEKAMSYCAKRGWKDPVITGATGKREDHTIGNVFRALDYGLTVVTDHGRFIPVCRKAAFKVKKGAAVSVFAPGPKTRMTSKGLKWPLDEVKFKNLHCATLNRATGTRIVLTSTHPVSVYIAS